MDLSNVVFIENKKSGKKKKNEKRTMVPPKHNEPWTKRKFGKLYRYCQYCKYWALHQPGEGKNCKRVLVDPVNDLMNSFGGKGSFQSSSWFDSGGGSTNGFVGKPEPSGGTPSFGIPNNPPFDFSNLGKSSVFGASNSLFSVGKKASNQTFSLGQPFGGTTSKMSPYGGEKRSSSLFVDNGKFCADNMSVPSRSFAAGEVLKTSPFGNQPTESCLFERKSNSPFADVKTSRNDFFTPARREPNPWQQPSIDPTQGLWTLNAQPNPPNTLYATPPRSPAQGSFLGFGHQQSLAGHTQTKSVCPTYQMEMEMEMGTAYAPVTPPIPTETISPPHFSPYPQITTPPLAASALAMPSFCTSDMFSLQMTALEAKRQEMERFLGR